VYGLIVYVCKLHVGLQKESAYSLSFVGVVSSGIKGGRPAVEKNVAYGVQYTAEISATYEKDTYRDRIRDTKSKLYVQIGLGTRLR
jgi:hypothetical protein